MTLLGLAVSVYVFPPRGEVPKADVIYVIGPPTAQRLAAAERLREAGVSDRILISVYREGSTRDNIRQCSEDGVECMIAYPGTTKGEAALLAEYFGTHSDGTVGSAVVLTVTPHVARTRYVFGRCYPGEVTVVPVDEPMSLRGWMWHFAYQTGAFVKSILTPC